MINEMIEMIPTIHCIHNNNLYDLLSDVRSIGNLEES